MDNKRIDKFSYDNQVYLIDVLEGLKRLEDNSADLIIIDPPYNIKKDFGNNHDNLELDAYVQWAKAWIMQCMRILKPGALAYCYGFSEILARLSSLINIKQQRWLIWHYKNKTVPSLNFWQRSHEAIICFWKGLDKNHKIRFNRDLVREPYSTKFLKNSVGKNRSQSAGRFHKSGTKYVSTYQAHPKGALGRDVIEIATLAGGKGMQERFCYCKDCQLLVSPDQKPKHLEHKIVIHPTQKPMALTTKLINSVSIDTGVKLNICIPFIGSGSEAVVASQLGHNFIGFEINPDYQKLAQHWIKAAVSKK